MINKIIYFSIQHKFLVVLLLAAIIGGGVYSLRTINVDSTPDITNNQVQVITVSENLSTADIEQFVTYPVELAMSNLPGVEDIRSISRFGLSVVTIVFKEDMGTYLPRQLVQEKLEEVREDIPEGFGTPEMGPISTGLGEILQYAGAAHHSRLDSEAPAVHDSGRGGGQLVWRKHQAIRGGPQPPAAQRHARERGRGVRSPEKE